ncbi:ketopantoate reductase PanE/ApbA C terminal-domain-containing protein [Camillea tinctor]|nr:ketopantoate reductase PanE/ApbA C terminal-domain-containing protein [Camillea tinctor]
MNPLRGHRVRSIIANRIAAARMSPLHTSASCRTSPENTIPAEWLRRILADRSETSPKLYAWTLANLPGIAAPPPATAPSAADTEHRRIYILGVGNMGRLYATCLARRRPAAERPPITLVVHKRELLEHWASHPGIELARAGQPQAERRADFAIEWWTPTRPEVGPVAEPAAQIPNLIVATKAADALPTVDSLRRYLGPRSTVAFAQNGMCKLWPPTGAAYARARFAPQKSPSWLACVTTHGVTSLGPFRSLHAAPANALVGPVLLNADTAAEAEYLVDQLARAPGLECRRVPRRELWVAQLEKLVVNAVINPLTAVLRCKNGELFARRDGSEDLAPVIDALVDEASRTLCALVVDPSTEPILAGDGVQKNGDSAKSLKAERETLLERFSFSSLQKMLLVVGEKVAENTSSMLQDVRAGKQTEIQDFNGWLVETARYIDKDVRLPLHEKLITLVEDGAVLSREQLRRHLIPTER